jgi:hypothetical protein
MSAEKIPQKREITEFELVQDMAEGVADHGYKVTKHTVTHDHEREETKLAVTFVKANPNQTTLKLAENPGGDD